MGTQEMDQDEFVSLSTPLSFPAFPYDLPYAIQLDLMKHIYDAIEARKVTIVESPTGTGKTLSLLCGSMSWLKDEQDKARKGQLDALKNSLKGESDEPEWVLQQSLELRRKELGAIEEELAERLERARKREESARRMENGRVRKKQKTSHEAEKSSSLAGEDDDVFLPEGAFGDSQNEADYSHFSPDVIALLKQLDNQNKPVAMVEQEEKEPVCTKIYYASRTHTQLSQTISELRRTKFDESIRTVSLGSRKNLCINEELRQKGGDLDEACRELMAEKKGKRCPYMPPAGDESRMLDLRDHILATPRDIEDIFVLGKDTSTCPYYGSRKAIPQAELVTLPYNLLLQKNSREALGIDLTNHVVIIDEAHNLIDTILSVHSLPLNHTTIRASLSQVSTYLSRFRNRLNPQNVLHLRRLVIILSAIDKYCESQGAKGGNAEMMLGVAEFVESLGPKVKDINFLEVDRYLRESKIARKISGYCDKVAEEAAAKESTGTKANNSKKRGVTPPLHAVESFLIALTHPSEDGRIFVSNIPSASPTPTVQLKYQLLNPSNHFEEVVSQARSVVLAGGTMEPISDLHNQLLNYLLPSNQQEGARLSNFSCGHIIPKENLMALVVERGPKGGEMKFKFNQRGDKDLLIELGLLLMNLVNIVPAGMVVFVPSYSFLNVVKQIWEEAGTLTKLGLKKKILFEPQESSEVENVLRDYASAVGSGGSSEQVTKTSGALLFAVVGAKLSEGLNFTDDLARAVVIVGLPFANLGSVELKERMKYVTELEKKSGGSSTGTKDAGMELYENLCMKAVNQSIGRAIRHKGDWASLILVDSRYSSRRIRDKLPKWIGKDVVVTEKFGQVIKELAGFYRSKKPQ
ncbi:ATP-dependent DNA helicase chl1 [Tulasnella sp. 419]|nr:ATP-dependent DNA helicase chl1 [Tulasnella sp. 419]